MSTGFRYVLAGSCAVALLFVTLSLWSYVPQMDIIWVPRGGSQVKPAPAAPGPLAQALPPSPAPAHPATGTPATPAAATPAVTAPAAPVHSAPGQPLSLHSPGAGALTAITQLDSTEPELWLLTTGNAVVRKKPGGDPLLAPSVSHAPLTVFSGSYLREVRREHGWVLILSPSHTLGWVHERQVRPVDM